MHNRVSDEKLLMQFVALNCDGSDEITNAISRLSECHRLELQDYGVQPAELTENKDMPKAKRKDENYLDSNSLGTILVFAARYAHSRNTGAALQVVRSILKSWDLLDLRTKEELIHEAKEEATCNHEDWQMIIKKLPSLSTDE